MVSVSCAAGGATRFLSLIPPFSSFEYVDREFYGINSLRRVFSQARRNECRSAVIEKLQPTCEIIQENEDIERFFSSDWVGGEAIRLSFWRPHIQSEEALASASDADLVGYAILKRDIRKCDGHSRWHIYESVLRPPIDAHCFLPRINRFSVKIQGRSFSVSGVKYCQQNGLNKACAQVALRSLISLAQPYQELSYRELHELAVDVSGPFNPAEGLSTKQIRGILDALGIHYFDLDYEATKDDGDLRRIVPYQKLLYAGIESGCGALIGFSLSGPSAGDDKHIIPVFGHTFTADTWVPQAELSYFNVGADTRYLPSDTWLGDFIGHDDNFGSNFFLPKRYIPRDNVAYVLGLLPSGARYNGLIAEVQALDYLYSLGVEFRERDGPWIRRLAHYTSRQEVVIRAICVPRSGYVQHLQTVKDWEGHGEADTMCEVLADTLPDQLWVAEISLPELFPANLRKIGEIVLDAAANLDTDPRFSEFIFARLPGHYFVIQEITREEPRFERFHSTILSHVPLIEER